MPIYVGRAKNFFKEAGIDLELVVTRGDGPDVQALMAKEVEFVATPPHHLYTLYLQNRKLLGVCGVLGRCGINMVISKEAAAERDVSERLAVREEARGPEGADLRRLDARARSPTTWVSITFCVPASSRRSTPRWSAPASAWRRSRR